MDLIQQLQEQVVPKDPPTSNDDIHYPPDPPPASSTLPVQLNRSYDNDETTAAVSNVVVAPETTTTSTTVIDGVVIVDDDDTPDWIMTVSPKDSEVAVTTTTELLAVPSLGVKSSSLSPNKQQQQQQQKEQSHEQSLSQPNDDSKDDNKVPSLTIITTISSTQEEEKKDDPLSPLTQLNVEQKQQQNEQQEEQLSSSPTSLRKGYDYSSSAKSKVVATSSSQRPLKEADKIIASYLSPKTSYRSSPTTSNKKTFSPVVSTSPTAIRFHNAITPSKQNTTTGSTATTAPINLVSPVKSIKEESTLKQPPPLPTAPTLVEPVTTTVAKTSTEPPAIEPTVSGRSECSSPVPSPPSTFQCRLSSSDGTNNDNIIPMRNDVDKKSVFWLDETCYDNPPNNPAGQLATLSLPITTTNPNELIIECFSGADANNTSYFHVGGMQIISNARHVDVHLLEPAKQQPASDDVTVASGTTKIKDNNESDFSFLMTCRGIPVKTLPAVTGAGSAGKAIANGYYKAMCVVPGGARAVYRIKLTFKNLAAPVGAASGTPNDVAQINSIRLTARVPTPVAPSPGSRSPNSQHGTTSSVASRASLLFSASAGPTGNVASGPSPATTKSMFPSFLSTSGRSASSASGTWNDHQTDSNIVAAAAGASMMAGLSVLVKQSEERIQKGVRASHSDLEQKLIRVIQQQQLSINTLTEKVTEMQNQLEQVLSVVKSQQDELSTIKASNDDGNESLPSIRQQQSKTSTVSDAISISSAHSSPSRARASPPKLTMLRKMKEEVQSVLLEAEEIVTGSGDYRNNYTIPDDSDEDKESDDEGDNHNTVGGSGIPRNNAVKQTTMLPSLVEVNSVGSNTIGTYDTNDVIPISPNSGKVTQDATQDNAEQAINDDGNKTVVSTTGNNNRQVTSDGISQQLDEESNRGDFACQTSNDGADSNEQLIFLDERPVEKSDNNLPKQQPTIPSTQQQHESINFGDMSCSTDIAIAAGGTGNEGCMNNTSQFYYEDLLATASSIYDDDGNLKLKASSSHHSEVTPAFFKTISSPIPEQKVLLQTTLSPGGTSNVPSFTANNNFNHSLCFSVTSATGRDGEDFIMIQKTDSYDVDMNQTTTATNTRSEQRTDGEEDYTKTDTDFMSSTSHQSLSSVGFTSISGQDDTTATTMSNNPNMNAAGASGRLLGTSIDDDYNEELEVTEKSFLEGDILTPVN